MNDTHNHKPEPLPGTIRSARIGADQNTRPLEYPHEAACLHCAHVIRLGQQMPIGPIGTWQHTSRITTQET
jgi:hypothetical protein